MQRLHSSNSPQTPYRNSDFDFEDVFGGPPRWVLVQEIRHGEGAESHAPRRNDEPGNPWSGLSEKPVFGDEGLNRRRFLSPAKPLPPKAEPFQNSLPAQFSLPAKLDDGIVHPTFGSATGSTYRKKDGESKGSSSFLFSPLSRSRSRSSTQEEESQLRNGIQSSKRLSALSRGLSLGREEWPDLIKRDETETRSNSMKGLNDSEVLNNTSCFHLSIHKWASKGIPLGVPLRGGNGSRLKEKDKLDKLERCSSHKAWESMAKGLPTAASPDTAFASDDRISATAEPSRMDPDNTGTADGELCQTNKEAKVSTPESEALSHLGGTVENVNADIAFCNTGEEMASCSLPENTVDKTERAGKNESANSVKKSSVILDAVENIKKEEGRRNCFNIADVGKTSMQGSPRNSGNFGKSKVKGKLKEFVKMFNQDTLLKPRINTL
ncbi:hypothetical protein SLEP1_g16917 [Rubroshorea leprosula]|uniref:Uncharacterized protein n=1 Tax=Rubroshorea leprosula TaxID=152421 RepID=A0AAV5IW80_9ROSI|nr:hypothetical protein SLEP1_g16917 [Rubroshorea leprosula]